MFGALFLENFLLNKLVNSRSHLRFPLQAASNQFAEVVVHATRESGCFCLQDLGTQLINVLPVIRVLSLSSYLE